MFGLDTGIVVEAAVGIVILLLVLGLVVWDFHSARVNAKTNAERQRLNAIQEQQRLKRGAQIWPDLPLPVNGKLTEPISEDALQRRFRMKIQLAQVQINIAIEFLDRADRYLDSASQLKVSGLRAALAVAREQARSLARQLPMLTPLIDGIDPALEVDSHSLLPEEEADILEVPRAGLPRILEPKSARTTPPRGALPEMTTTQKDTPFDDAVRAVNIANDRHGRK